MLLWNPSIVSHKSLQRRLWLLFPVAGQRIRSARCYRLFVPTYRRSTFESCRAYFFCRRTDSLEWTAGWFEWSAVHSNQRTLPRVGAWEVFTLSRFIHQIYLLTYSVDDPQAPSLFHPPMHRLLAVESILSVRATWRNKVARLVFCESLQ